MISLAPFKGCTQYYGTFNSNINLFRALGFIEQRDLRDYTDSSGIAAAHSVAINATKLGIRYLYGVSSNPTTITATNWPDFRAKILTEAQWAQENGIYEFLIGNEEELHVDGTTMSIAQIIINLKSVATDVQAIFTRGNVVYSCWQEKITDWVSLGKGDIDLLASNVYMEYGSHQLVNWKSHIDDLVAGFGTNGCYLTEFGLSTVSVDAYSTDEEIQATSLAKMMDYIVTSGIKRALFFNFLSDSFGAIKADGTYRLLLNVLTNKRRWFYNS